MAFDFPASPSVGQIYAPAGGPSYQWDGTVWKGLGLTASGVPYKCTVFSSIGTSTAFQYDPASQAADIEVVGGGGGGGGTAGSAAAGQSAAGGGGSAGGYVKKLIQITDAIRAATKTITVGGGGAGGSNGGNSSYADGVSSLAGNGGVAGTAGNISGNMAFRYGNNGGGASGGDINSPGQPGGIGWSSGASDVGANLSAACGGHGGSGPWGGGGIGVNNGGAVSGGTGATGGNATGFGAGGGGGYIANVFGSNASGGTGYQGCVIITEYLGVAAIGVPDAPSDGNEYTRVNGVWRLSKSLFYPTGAAGQNIAVPATAKTARIFGKIYAGAQPTAPIMRWSADGSTFVSGATDYTYGGTQTFSGSSASPSKLSTTNASAVVLTPTSDNLNIAEIFDVDLIVNKPASPASFTARYRGSAYNSNAAIVFAELIGMAYSNNASIGAITQMPAFQIAPSGGSWAAGSLIQVEWVY